ncbi:MAG: hypothetical protein QM767_08655 [Anaeromyxobacter sp.]
MPGFSSPLRSRERTSVFPSGVRSTTAVRSSPPVSCTGKRSGPSSRQTCDVPVTLQVKKSRRPSSERSPSPGARTSFICWMRRPSPGSMGRGAKRCSTSGVTLARPRPL